VERAQAARISRDISAERLAADSRVDRAYVSGIANPTIDVLERIAAVLRVELVELFVRPSPDEEPPRTLRGGRRRKV
jgi:transcriptional regulator with XRE-family HTH domain